VSFGETPSKISPSPKTMEKLTAWAKKIGRDVDELLKRWEQEVKTAQAAFPGATREFYDTRARHAVAMSIALQLRTRAVPVNAVLIGVNVKRDITEPQRRLALEEFKKDPTAAIAKGLVNADGVPLDTRKTLGVLPSGEPRPNPRYGKPIQPFYQKNVIGIGYPIDEKARPMKLINLVLRGPQADLEVPIGEPVRFRANVRTELKDKYIMASGVATVFDKHPFPEVAGKTVIDLLNAAPPEIKPSVFELFDWHMERQEEVTRTAIIFGDAIGKSEEPSAAGGYLVLVGDVDEDPEFEGVPCFLPENWLDTIKSFGVGSKVFVIGQTALGVDLTTGERTRVIINGYGIFVHPDYKVEPSETRVFMPTPPDLEIEVPEEGV